MNNYQLPGPHTQEAQTATDIEILREGTDREKALVWIKAFSSNRHLPKTADYNKILRDATNEFQRNDYSEALDYVQSLAELVEHYQDLAQNFADTLEAYGAVLNEYGDVAYEPVVIVDQYGNELFGRPEVLVFERHDKEELWHYYIKPRLGTLTEQEERWVADNFQAQIKEEENENPTREV